MSSKKNGYCFTRKQVRCRYTQIYLLYIWFYVYIDGSPDFSTRHRTIPLLLYVLLMGKPDCLPSLWTKPLNTYVCFLQGTQPYTTNILWSYIQKVWFLYFINMPVGFKTLLPWTCRNAWSNDKLYPFPWAKFWKSPFLYGWNQSNHRSGSSCKIR